MLRVGLGWCSSCTLVDMCINPIKQKMLCISLCVCVSKSNSVNLIFFKVLSYSSSCINKLPNNVNTNTCNKVGIGFLYKNVYVNCDCTFTSADIELRFFRLFLSVVPSCLFFLLACSPLILLADQYHSIL